MRALAASKNLYRRHLTAEQKRKAVANELKAHPEKSNNAIAKDLKVVSDKTVAAVRAELESTSEIPKLDKTTGKDGKARKQPTKKPKGVVATSKARARASAAEIKAAERENKERDEEATAGRRGDISLGR